MGIAHHMPPHPDGTSTDWTEKQRVYTPTDHQTWLTLYDRQIGMLRNRACDEFMHGLDALDLRGTGVPDFESLSKRLHKLTGWSVVAVPGLVPDAVFFEHLANRRFPAGNFIRRPDQLDYLSEPDVFHDVFGHVPMLTDPVFADYMEAYGRGGLRALGLEALHNLARLYWYTVEFGLIETTKGLRIYGAGIVSSFSETQFSLEDPSPNRLGFGLENVMRRPYRIDDFQQVYFVIPSLQHLLDVTVETDFGPLYERLAAHSDIGLTAITEDERVFTRGTQSYAARQGPQ